MRIAYFDCFSGISGDMALGAFLDAGLSFGLLSKELAKLKLKGYELKSSSVKRQQIACTKFGCVTKPSPHSHRSLKEINLLIDKSALNGNIKKISKEIFANLGAAEARVHGNGRSREVVLHELGDIDSIIDIVGVAIAVDSLGIDEIYASKLSLGRTMVDTRHGKLPAPSPAALELLKRVPVAISEIEAELVTPTGAAILKTLVKEFGHMPQVKISSIGYGAGSSILAERPNMLRVLIGERISAPLRKIYDEAKRMAFFLTACYLLLVPNTLYADTIYTNEGKEVRGIVVEDYKDRIVLSTVSGEVTIMKSDIKELYFDEEEENLIKLAEQAKEKRDYIKALTYYDLAFRRNPNSKAAKDGLVFLEGYLFRKEQAQKEADVKRREELESQGAAVPVVKPEAEEISEKAGRLKKALGITIDIKDGLPQVLSVQRNSPAEDAGVMKGDKIAAIWARLTGYMDLRETMDTFLDKPSLELKCTLERMVDLEVSRFKFIVPSSNLVGASFAMELEGLTIASVKELGPAANAGLKKSDRITAIDGKSTRYIPLEKAVGMIRHSQNRTVRLTIRRETLMWRRD